MAHDTASLRARRLEAKRRRRRRRQATGLALLAVVFAAVAGIVRGHRGAIRVTTAPGQGTSFLVLFPAMPYAYAITGIVNTNRLAVTMVIRRC